MERKRSDIEQIFEAEIAEALPNEEDEGSEEAAT